MRQGCRQLSFEVGRRVIAPVAGAALFLTLWPAPALATSIGLGQLNDGGAQGLITGNYAIQFPADPANPDDPNDDVPAFTGGFNLAWAQQFTVTTPFVATDATVFVDPAYKPGNAFDLRITDGLGGAASTLFSA